jgi:hypothetical protein
MALLPKRFYEFHQNPVLQEYRERANHHQHWAGLLSFNAAHAIDRMKERYNVSVTGQDWERLNWAIFREMSDTKLLMVKNEDTTIYQVRYNPFMRGRTRTLNVMFSESAFCITTAIPVSDLRVLAVEQGEKKCNFTPLLKARYEMLIAYRKKKFGQTSFPSRPED